MEAASTEEQALQMKEKANKLFKACKYQDAIDEYTKAVELDPSNAVLYSNRSAAHLKMESYGYALQDASTAIELDKAYVKGYYRRASANMALGKFKLALKDYEAVRKAKPKDSDAKAKYEECSRIVRQHAFEKAIRVDSAKSVVDTLDWEAIVVEESYDGPRLEGDVTAAFMSDLLEHFRLQKRLHRKYAYKVLVEVKKIFCAQPSLVDIQIPQCGKYTVCGDIHGQFYDLLNIFKLNGVPSLDNPYVSAHRLVYCMS